MKSTMNYPYESKSQRETNRKIAQTRSQILKTSEEIRLEVKNELDNLSASFSVQLDEITSTVNGLSGAVSKIEQKVGNITLSVSNKTSSSSISLSVGGVVVSSQTIKFTGDVVFESDLRAGNTTVSGDCITTGEVNVDYIKLGGQMNVYRSSGSSTMGGYMGYVTGRDFNGSRTSGMGMLDPDENNQVVVTNAGARLTSPNAEVVVATNVTLQTTNAVDVRSNRFTSDVELNVTSDRRAKDEIRYDVDRYISVFDHLRPASFLLKGKGANRHLGFIAQDVEQSLGDTGISMDDFAALSIDESGRYGLSYGEFVPLITAKVQEIDRRLKTLEGLWKT